jgi:hypothetical protein
VSGQAKSNPAEDSLDRIQRLMAIEESLIDQIQADPRLDPHQRERLIREIEARIERAELGDDLAALVRKLGPRGPRGKAGAAAAPPERAGLE